MAEDNSLDELEQKVRFELQTRAESISGLGLEPQERRDVGRVLEVLGHSAGIDIGFIVRLVEEVKALRAEVEELRRR